MADLMQSVVDKTGIGTRITAGEERMRTLQGRETSAYDDYAKAQEKEAGVVRAKSAELAPIVERGMTMKSPEVELQQEKAGEFKRPTMDPKEMQEAFGLMLAASLFVGAATRAPFYGAMNAMTGAMQGFMKQDAAIVDEKLKEYKTNLDALKERNYAKRAEYDAVWNKYKNNISELDRQMKLVDRKYDSELLLAQHGTKGTADRLKQTEKQITDEEKSLDRNYKALATLQEHRDRMAQVAATREAARSAKAAASAPAEADPNDEKMIKMLADRWRQGDSSALTGLGWGAKGVEMRKAVLRQASIDADKAGQTGGDLAAQRSSFQADTSALRQFQNYVNRLDQLGGKIDRDIDVMFKVAEKGVGPSKVPAFDRWVQVGRRATGDADVTAFDTAIQTIKNEYGRSMAGPASNAQLHVSAMEHADQLINSSMNMGQLKATIKVMRADIKNQQDQAVQQIRDIKERLAKTPKPKERASDETRDALKEKYGLQ